MCHNSLNKPPIWGSCKLFLIFTIVITLHSSLVFSSCLRLSLFHWMCSWKWFKGHVEFECFDLYCHFAFQTFDLFYIPTINFLPCLVWPYLFPSLPDSLCFQLCSHTGPLSTPLSGAGQACRGSGWSTCSSCCFFCSSSAAWHRPLMPPLPESSLHQSPRSFPC